MSRPRTVWMPHAAADELHSRRAQRVVSGEFEFGCEDAAFEGGALRALDQCFPVEHVIFGDGACGDAFGWVGREVFVFVEEALLSDRRRHFVQLIGMEMCCRHFRWQGAPGFGGI